MKHNNLEDVESSSYYNVAPERNSETYPRQKSSGGHDIAKSSNLLIAPAFLLTAMLLAYIFLNQIKDVPKTSDNLDYNFTVPNDHAVYASVSATKLIFLASWSSSIIPILGGFAIALAAYPVSDRLLEDSGNNRASRLPTAYQLHIILKFINGSTWGALWDLLGYRLRRRNKNSHCSTALLSLFYVALSAIFISVLVIIADTWLHIATRTVNLVEVQSISGDNAMYGLTALPACLLTNNSKAAIYNAGVDCTLNSTMREPNLQNPLAVLQTVTNKSDDTAVLQMPGHSISYIGVAPSALDPAHDFVASTFGINTFCKSISRSCNLSANGNITFDCANGAFYAKGRTFAQTGNFVAFFKYSNLSDIQDARFNLQQYGVYNPFYVTAAIQGQVLRDSGLRSDPDVLPSGNWIYGVFQCQLQVVDIEYSWINGLASLLSSTPSNESTTNMFVSGAPNLNLWSTELDSAVLLGTLQSKNAEELADKIGVALRHGILSAGAGSVQRSPARQAQIRKTILATRIPYGPLFLLVSSNLAYVIFAIPLTILAAKTSNTGRAAQYRMTVAGIVAQLFERDQHSRPSTGTQHFFQEYHNDMVNPSRIGMERNSQGGLGFESIPLQDSHSPEVNGQIQDSPEARRSRIISLLSLQSMEQHGLSDDADILRFKRHSYFRDL